MWFFRPEKFFFERLSHDADLFTEIRDIFGRSGSRMGFFTAVGAVKSARIAFYDQNRKEYIETFLDGPAEILSCVGNISDIEGDVSVHAHITLGYADSSVRGGHLLEGTTIFACELFGVILEGDVLHRKFDDITGLKLWDITMHNK